MLIENRRRDIQLFSRGYGDVAGGICRHDFLWFFVACLRDCLVVCVGVDSSSFNYMIMATS